MSQKVEAELVLLRAFYVAWGAFHSIPRDVVHRRRQEAAAQEMVDAANTLKIFYEANASKRPKLELVPGDQTDNVIATDFDKRAEYMELRGKANG